MNRIRPSIQASLMIAYFAVVANCSGQSFEETFGLRPVRLNMRQVLAGALANSMDVKIEYADFEIAQAQIDGAGGKFDPVLSFSGARQDNRTAQNAQEYVQTGGLIVPRASPHLFNQTNTQAETSLE
jgi:outer membrane protein TolC